MTTEIEARENRNNSRVRTYSCAKPRIKYHFPIYLYTLEIVSSSPISY